MPARTKCFKSQFEVRDLRKILLFAAGRKNLISSLQHVGGSRLKSSPEFLDVMAACEEMKKTCFVAKLYFKVHLTFVELLHWFGS